MLGRAFYSSNRISRADDSAPTPRSERGKIRREVRNETAHHNPLPGVSAPSAIPLGSRRMILVGLAFSTIFSYISVVILWVVPHRLQTVLNFFQVLDW